MSDSSVVTELLGSGEAKICAFCKGQFLPRQRNQVFCKPACADQHWNQTRPVRRTEFLPSQNETTRKRESRARKMMGVLANGPVRTHDLMRLGGSGFSSRLAELREDLIRFGWGIRCETDDEGGTYFLEAL